MNIEEVAFQISRNLSSGLSLKESLDKVGYAVPQQSHPQVTLLDANRRKKKRNASAENWSPESGVIEIRLEPVLQEHKNKRIFSEPPNQTENLSSTKPQELPRDTASLDSFLHPAEAELLRALDRAESKPGWSFVPLKKFRDDILPLEARESIPSLRTEVEQRHILQSVIDKRFVLVGKVPNPKSPQFPVTTIRLNRLMPQVKVALGREGNLDADFHPIEIQGEPLSTTILRERR
jgi:hypothetical protein